MDERTPPPDSTDRAPATRDFIREGKQVARDLCQELGLPAPHATGFPSTALIDGLAAARGWTVTVRVAAPNEWHEMEERNVPRRGDVSTGEVRSTGPGSWEIVVIPGTSTFHQDTITLTLLTHVVRDDVPLSGRARLAGGGTTYEEAVARVFAREITLLFMRASRWGRPLLGTVPDRTTPAPWLTRATQRILRLYGVDDPDRVPKKQRGEAGDDTPARR